MVEWFEGWITGCVKGQNKKLMDRWLDSEKNG